MERTTSSKRKGVREYTEPQGFDVTCVIGRVEFEENATESPTEVAFKLIAQHDAPGTFTFPGGAIGMTYRITVEHEFDTSATESPREF